jgi:hypothetical protein
LEFNLEFKILMPLDSTSTLSFKKLNLKI